MSVDFIDSNVFIYVFDETAPMKRKRAEDLIQVSLQRQSGCISYQVVQETLNALSHKFRRKASPDDAHRFLRDVLAPLWRVVPSEDLYHKAIDIKDRYRYGFYDSLIIGGALVAGCQTLYSEDFQNGQVIEGMTIRDPFGS